MALFGRLDGRRRDSRRSSSALELAPEVDAVVLDAPMLDFSSTVDDNASREPLVGPLNVPPSLTWAARMDRRAAVRRGLGRARLPRGPVDLRRADARSSTGTDDPTVPIATSQEAAELRPDTVVLGDVRRRATTSSAGTVDPQDMQDRIVAFLDQQVGA